MLYVVFLRSPSNIFNWICARAQTFDEYKPNYYVVFAKRFVSVSESENVIVCLLLWQIDTILLSCSVKREPLGIIHACTNLMMHYDFVSCLCYKLHAHRCLRKLYRYLSIALTIRMRV